MAFSPSEMIGNLVERVRDVLPRREPKDAFGGEADPDVDEFDEDEPRSKGARIALIASGVFFVVMIGLAVTVYLVGRNVPATDDTEMEASLGDMAVEEDLPADATPNAPTASVAATDRSAERRPWLNGGTQPTPAGKPGAAVMTPPPPPAPAPAAPQTPEPAKTAAAPEPAKKMAAEEPPAAEPNMPSVLAAETAPGAPDRFSETGALTAGGRPRLAEPPLPPIDKKALAAPPPRYAALADMRPKAAAAAAAKPSTGKAATDKTGKIAVVVQGLGLSMSATEAAVSKLPPQVALSFSPYAHDLKKWLERAKATGHEVLVEVPMESKKFPAEDPGPLGLLTSLQAKENGERLDTIFKVCPGAIGIHDGSGSKFREAEGPMRLVFAKLKEKNLFYIQGEPGAHISEPGVPNAIADVVIDERPFRAAIDARLDYAERLAKYQGSAVTVMSAKPVSFERLALWLDQLDKRGIALTPVSQVLVR